MSDRFYEWIDRKSKLLKAVCTFLLVVVKLADRVLPYGVALPLTLVFAAAILFLDAVPEVKKTHGTKWRVGSVSTMSIIKMHQVIDKHILSSRRHDLLSHLDIMARSIEDFCIILCDRYGIANPTAYFYAKRNEHGSKWRTIAGHTQATRPGIDTAINKAISNGQTSHAAIERNELIYIHLFDRNHPPYSAMNYQIVLEITGVVPSDRDYGESDIRSMLDNLLSGLFNRLVLEVLTAQESLPHYLAQSARQ